MARIRVVGGDGTGGHPLWKIAVPLAFVVVVLVFVTTTWFQVDSDSVGVVTRFGRYDRTESPGLHWKLPLGVEAVAIVPVRHVHKMEFGFRTAAVDSDRTRYDERNFPAESLMLTGDLNAAEVEWIVQYRISDPKKFLFRVRDPENTLRDLSRAVMSAVVGDHSVLEVLTEGRREVNQEAHDELQRLTDLYEMGLSIETVQLQGVDPPEKVRASFNDVNQAEQERVRTSNEAGQEYNKMIPLAEGEAQKVKQQAEGYAIDRVNRATGETQRFLAVLAEYQKAPEVTHRRLWLETIARVLPKLSRKIIVDDDVRSLLPVTLGAGLGTEGGQVKLSTIVVVLVVVAGALIASGSLFTVGEAEQVIVTEFGRPVGDPITSAGLHWKTPFVQDVRRFEKRVLRWDGEPREISTREKKFIFIDTMARWRIENPLTFLQSVGDVENAQQRLDNIIDGVVKDTISSTALIDVVRSTSRAMAVDTDQGIGGSAGSGFEEAAEVVTIGRPKLLQHVTEEAAKRLIALGIELLDVRITRVNFVDKVLQDVYRRMISERQRIAERFRSEGQGERARILGQLEKEQKRITSEAFRDAEKTRGEADAQAARIYADAYSKDADFYAFVRSLETLETAVADGTTTALLSTKGGLLNLLKDPGSASGAKH